MSRSPRFIYFDLGNVLVTFCRQRAARQMAQVAGLAPEQVTDIVFGTDLEERYERGEVSSEEFYEEFCERSRTRPDCASLLDAGADIFELNVSLAPLLSGLRSVRNRLGVLSNTNESHWNFIYEGRFVMLRSAFETHVLSFEVGAMKPDPLIYKVAAEQAGVECNEIFFTDDRLENVIGAREAGIDAVQFVSARQLAAELRNRGVQFNY